MSLDINFVSENADGFKKYIIKSQKDNDNKYFNNLETLICKDSFSIIKEYLDEEITIGELHDKYFIEITRFANFYFSFGYEGFINIGTYNNNISTCISAKDSKGKPSNLIFVDVLPMFDQYIEIFAPYDSKIIRITNYVKPKLNNTCVYNEKQNIFELYNGNKLYNIKIIDHDSIKYLIEIFGYLFSKSIIKPDFQHLNNY